MRAVSVRACADRCALGGLRHDRATNIWARALRSFNKSGTAAVSPATDAAPSEAWHGLARSGWRVACDASFADVL